MKTLSFIYLMRDQQNAEDICENLSCAFTGLFRTFYVSSFASPQMPHDCPAIRVVPVRTLDELLKTLFVDGAVHNGFLTDSGKECALFLIDDHLHSGNTPEPLPFHQARVDGWPLTRWLDTYFPAQPKIVISYGRYHGDHLDSLYSRWLSKPHTILENLNQDDERMQHLFRSLWEPQFWHCLYKYVTQDAGVSWHTPGHNSGNLFQNSVFLNGFWDEFSDMSFRCDLSVSVHALGDLSKPESRTPLANAQRLSAEIFGAAQSCYITNGSSTANKAMLTTLLRPGEYVLLDRNCHKSVHHAMVMTGAIPIYLPTRFNTRLGLWEPVALSDLRNAILRRYPEARRPRVLILTTCTYDGILYPVWEIAKLCESKGMLFYADEAWAPYLSFHPYYTWQGAGGEVRRYNAIHESSGAHFAVHSIHKTMASFSQGSMIHVSFRFKRLLETKDAKWEWLRKRFSFEGRGSYSKFRHNLYEVLRYWHSTSPNYPMLATLDCAGVQMRLEGMNLIEERLRWIEAFKQRVAKLCGKPVEECFVELEAVVGERAEEYVQAGYMHDPLKMTISFKNPEVCRNFQRLLHRSKIQWEKSTPVTILFLVTMGTCESHFEYLYHVIMRMKDAIGAPDSDSYFVDATRAVTGQPVVSPRDAALCDGEQIPLRLAEGRIASQLLVPYPPGIPLFLPGVRITREMIEIIQTVTKNEGPDAVHGLLIRNGENYLEVIREDEYDQLQQTDAEALGAGVPSNETRTPLRKS
ncbi:MAG: hypothetical protein IJU44_08965 [Kiritimatiellae bacterium]|nr:hypothetical protein [Kiritimatiellia bacterium]